MSEFLTFDELRELTQRARRDGQAEFLQSVGIPFRRADQRLIVSRHHVREWLSGRPVAPSREVNLGAVK